MARHKGGRGLKAPYRDTHIRVPLGLRVYVKNIINKYRELVLAGKLDPNVDSAEIPELEPRRIMPLDELLPIVSGIVRQTRSPRQAVANLLTVLYNVDIDPKKL